MNQSNPDMFYPSQISTGQGNPPQTVTSSGLTHYQHAQQHPPLMQSTSTQYGSSQGTPYGSYGYTNGITSPQTAGGHQMATSMHGSVVSLPPMSATQSLLSGQGFASQQSQGFDTTGQQAPHGMKPRVTATLWEDEGSLCFQVEAKGICVARREDNHMINGTKLLNVAGMTRGRRDGILKSEKQRHVVKIGPMHLKGVWIPFDRALDFANKEKITDLLYPLFVHNIGALLYHPTNSNRTNVVMAHAERRKAEQSHMRNSQSQNGLPPLSHHHHHSMQSPVGSGQLANSSSTMSNTIMPRPDMHRAHTFPTPPTSASGVMTTMGSSDAFQWTGPAMAGMHAQSNLSIDTGLSNARSMPSTPATTPPNSSVQTMQYQQNPQTYDTSRQLYSAPPLQSPFQHPSTTQQGMNRYSTLPYIKQEMGPPGGRPLGSEDQHETTKNTGLYQNPQQSTQVSIEDEAEHEHDTSYIHDNHTSDDNGRPYTYAPLSSAGDRNHLGQDLNGSPNHSSGQGRATPRTTSTAQPYYQQNGYNTPPQTLPPSSNLYNVMSSERGTTNGQNGEIYSTQSDNLNTSSNGYAQQPMQHGKRSRDEDDDSRSVVSRGEYDGLKRRKTVRENSLPHDANIRGRGTISQRRR